MAELDVDRYVPSEYLKRQVLSGAIETLTLRERVADPGDTFRIRETTFEITRVERGPVAELDVDAADVEGEAVVHTFERVS